MTLTTLCLTTECEDGLAPFLLEKLADVLEDYGYVPFEGSAIPKGDEMLTAGDMTPDGHLVEEKPWTELCPRCQHGLVWVQSSPLCPQCHWKAGCCEGEPQS
jgi:hypothetical protein